MVMSHLNVAKNLNIGSWTKFIAYSDRFLQGESKYDWKTKGTRNEPVRLKILPVK